MKTFPLALISAALATLLVAQTSQAGVLELLEQADDLETKSCLPKSQIRDMKSLDDNTLLFRTAGGTRWVNQLRSACTGMEGNSIIHQTPMNAYCDKDIIQIVDMRINMQMGSCALGTFTRVPRASDSGSGPD